MTNRKQNYCRRALRRLGWVGPFSIICSSQLHAIFEIFCSYVCFLCQRHCGPDIQSFFLFMSPGLNDSWMLPVSRSILRFAQLCDGSRRQLSKSRNRFSALFNISTVSQYFKRYLHSTIASSYITHLFETFKSIASTASAAYNSKRFNWTIGLIEYWPKPDSGSIKQRTERGDSMNQTSKIRCDYSPSAYTHKLHRR